MPVDRSDWLKHVREVVRSRHYTWLPSGLGGEDVESGMTWLIADIMHVCRLSGISFEAVYERARQQFELEENLVDE